MRFCEGCVRLRSAGRSHVRGMGYNAVQLMAVAEHAHYGAWAQPERGKGLRAGRRGRVGM